MEQYSQQMNGFNLSCQVLREERLVVHFTEEGCVSQLKAIFVKYCIQYKGFEQI